MTAQRAGLALGNEAKSARAAIRRRIAAGDIDVVPLLRGDGDEDVERIALDMTAAVLIDAVPGIGDAAAARILTVAGCGVRKRLGELTTAERRRLAHALRKELAS